MRAWLALLPLLTACGSAPSTGPSPVPTSTSVTVTITDTVSGAVIGSRVQAVNGLPAQITVSQAGYVTRETWISSADARVDLFPEAGFDLAFYRQLARNNFDAPGSPAPLRVLSQQPAFYLQTTGFSRETIAAMEATVRATVPAMSGGRFQVVTWETGVEPRAPRTGWITIEHISEPSGCGRANVGTATGRIWLNVTNAACPLHRTIAHEIGHALGFWHVDRPGSLMRSPRPAEDDTPSHLERHHAALAYARQAGNMDVDVDSRVPSTFQTAIVID